MDLFLIYLWLQLPSIFAFMFFLLFFCIVVTIMTINYFRPISRYRETDETKEVDKLANKRLKKAAKIGCSCVFTLILLISALPSKQDVAILVGAAYAFDLAKSPTGQKVKTLLVSKAEAMLDEAIKGEKK
jgi:4-hydroxybenzoate polyprenyltransferase